MAPGGMPPEQEVFKAIAQGNRGRLQALLVADPSLWVRARTTYKQTPGLTPLMYAIREGRRGLALWLIERRGTHDIDAGNSNGRTALHAACSVGDVPVIEALLRAGANPTLMPPVSALTPLMAAAYYGQSDAIAALVRVPAVREGIDVADVDEDGCLNALIAAACNDHVQAAKLLVEAGANPFVLNPPHDPYDYCKGIVKAVNHAKAEPKRCRLLRRLRALADGAQAALPPPSGSTATEKPKRQPKWVTARLARGAAMPRIEVSKAATSVAAGAAAAAAERLAGTAALALGLGLDGGGSEGGLLPELFVELLDMLVPRWDVGREGRPLGDENHTPAWVPNWS